MFQTYVSLQVPVFKLTFRNGTLEKLEPILIQFLDEIGMHQTK